MINSVVIVVLLLQLMLHVTVMEDDSLNSQVIILKGWLHFIFIKIFEFRIYNMNDGINTFNAGGGEEGGIIVLKVILVFIKLAWLICAKYINNTW